MEQKDGIQLHGEKYNKERRKEKILAFQKHILEKHLMAFYRFDMHFIFYFFKIIRFSVIILLHNSYLF